MLNFEYVTDPVLFPGLRCPACKSKVRVIRTLPTEKSHVAAVFAKLVTCLLLGVAAALGYLWETVWLFVFFAITVVPVVAIILYVRAVPQFTFFCHHCNAERTYREVSRS